MRGYYHPLTILRRLFCAHSFTFKRNIHGDEIIEAGYMRSVWVCGKCGKVQLRKSLYEEAQ